MKLSLSPLFRDHMILQANAPIRIFGTGFGTVQISFCMHTVCISAHGDWVAELPPLNYGGPYAMHIQLNEEHLTLSDVYLGDVYLLAGQSNMEFKLRESATDTLCYDDDPLIRFFMTGRMEAGERFASEDGWVPCTRTNAPDLSAIGYFLGHRLRQRTGHAIGFTCCYQGCSMIQSFLSPVAVKSLPEVHQLNLRSLEGDDGTLACPWNRDSVLYHFAAKMLFPYAHRAVIWYQGESNTNQFDCEHYDLLLKALIDDWRRQMRLLALPFVIVQLAEYDRKPGKRWDCICTHQAAADAWENVCTVPCADICETFHIHPPTKSLLAYRIADALTK